MPGMSPKDFRNISHPEQKILNSLVNWSHTQGHTHTHMHTQTDKCKSRADPTRGGSAENWAKIWKMNIPYINIFVENWKAFELKTDIYKF